jgi:hypothetical protein
MSRSQRIGLALMILGIYCAVVRFGTEGPRIEFCYGAFAYLLEVAGMWQLINGKKEDE